MCVCVCVATEIRDSLEVEQEPTCFSERARPLYLFKMNKARKPRFPHTGFGRDPHACYRSWLNGFAQQLPSRGSTAEMKNMIGLRQNGRSTARVQSDGRKPASGSCRPVNFAPFSHYGTTWIFSQQEGAELL